MSNASTITGIVLDTKRAGTSQLGNPAYDVTIRITEIEGTPVEVSHESLATVTLRTVANSGLAYEITNRNYRDEPHTFALAKSGRISHVVKD